MGMQEMVELGEQQGRCLGPGLEVAAKLEAPVNMVAVKEKGKARDSGFHPSAKKKASSSTGTSTSGSFPWLWWCLRLKMTQDTLGHLPFW